MRTTKMWKRTPSLMWWLVMALLTLLPLLAYFQYRWLDEVMRGEREMMKSNLQMSAAQFGQEFDREVRTALLHFEAELHSPIDQPEAVIARTYRRWQETAAHPRLIGEIYRTTIDERGERHLLKFVPASSRFEPGPWPESMKNFSGTIEGPGQITAYTREIFHSSDAPRQIRRFEKRTSRAFTHILRGPLDGEIPGLVIPWLPFKPFSRSGGRDLPLPPSFLILMFDLGYLKRGFIPELVKRHFMSEGGLDYYVAVVRPQEPNPIYQSDADLPADVRVRSDASQKFLNFHRPEVIKGWAAPGSPISAPSPDRQLAIGIDLEIMNNRAEEAGAKISLPPEPFPGSDFGGAWQIVVKHRAGSLEAAVAGTRRRNLAISFGILLLLGVSMGLIMLSSRRAQRLAQSQMEFVAGVSHELRTPLAVICSAGENLADGLIDRRDQVSGYGSLIRDEGRKLAGMVEQVLEFAGAHSERKRYELRPVDLKTVIESALSACQPQILERGFEIEQRMIAGSSSIEADAAALGRAIQNLLSNAIKYSGQSRWIGVSAERVKTPSGEEAQIKISDQGLGISPSELSHIFEPFYRGREVTAAQIHGNGLGLSLVKHIIEAHDGRVSVVSRLGQGTSFTLHLPVKPSAESSIDPAKKEYEQARLAH